MENRELLPCPFCGGNPISKCYPTLSYVECENNCVRRASWGPESLDKNGNKMNGVNGVFWVEVLHALWNTRHPSGGLVELDEDTIAICRETVGYLLVKANEIKNINAGNWVTFKKRAMALENLIEASQRFGQPKIKSLSVKEMTDVIRNVRLIDNSGRNRRWSVTRKQAEMIAIALNDISKLNSTEG